MSLTPDLHEARLGAVLRTALDAVVVMRLDGTVSGWNEVAERTFGWSFAEVTGRRMSELIIPPRHREAHERGLERYLLTGEGPVLDRHIEIEALDRTGRELPIELSITRTDEFGQPLFLGFLRDISERREHARRQDLLIGELDHRVKNMLAVVSGMAQQTARMSPDVATFSQAFEGRLQSLARAHEILTAASWRAAPLSALVETLLAPYRGEAGGVSWAGPPAELDSRQILSMSMVINELLTNALKYGALSRPDGKLAVAWHCDDAELHFEWSEAGLTGLTPPARSGFGLRMISLSIEHELRGRIETAWAETGVRHRLSFPLPACEE